jgi:hypothetical protein
MNQKKVRTEGKLLISSSSSSSRMPSKTNHRYKTKKLSQEDKGSSKIKSLRRREQTKEVKSIDKE